MERTTVVLTVDDPENPVPVFGLVYARLTLGVRTDDPSFVDDYTVNLKGGPLERYS